MEMGFDDDARILRLVMKASSRFHQHDNQDGDN